MVAKVVGIGESFTWEKNGRSGTGKNIYIVRAPSSNPRESGIIGFIATSLYIPESQFSLLNGLQINKDYSFNYESVDGRFTSLASISVVDK